MTIEMWARVFLDRDPEMMARVHAARRNVAAMMA
jgi:hypothetical protein